MLVEKIIGKIEETDCQGLTVDTVVLDRYDMNKPHQKVTTGMGETVAISLPHGENLFEGAVLYRDDEKIIVIELAPEDIFEIRPEGNRQWAKTAFNIGNMHQPAYIYDDRILIAYDPVMENVLKAVGVNYTRCQGKLDGERANVVIGGHSHSHDYEHSHEHHHDHEHSHEHHHNHEHSHEHDHVHDHEHNHEGKQY